MRANDGEITLELRQDLALEAFTHTAKYDAAIANYLAEQAADDQESRFPPLFTPWYEKVGGDLRYGLPWGRDSELRYAAAVGLQFTLGDRGNVLSVPFGISLGADVGTPERPVILFGLPYLTVNRYDHDDHDANTDLELGVELGGEVNITDQLMFSGVLTIASNDNDNIELALGLIYRR